MESAASVANALHSALALHLNKKPSNVEIRDALQHYQDSRLARVKEIVKIGGDLTRLQAYDGWKMYFTQRWLTPILGLDFLAKNIAKLCSGAPKLSYVEFEEERGVLGWKDTEAKNLKRGGKGKGGEDGREMVKRLFGAAIVCAALVLWVVLNGGKQVRPRFGMDVSREHGKSEVLLR